MFDNKKEKLLDPAIATTTDEAALPPLPAIRAHCLGCRGGSRVDVRTCNRKGCSLHEYRLGHRPAKGAAKRTPLEAIRAWWLWCMLGSPAEVRRSRETASPTWRYRFGKRPKLPSPVPTEIHAKSASSEASFDAGEPVWMVRR